jgi:hypothetical protein
MVLNDLRFFVQQVRLDITCVCSMAAPDSMTGLFIFSVKGADKTNQENCWLVGYRSLILVIVLPKYSAPLKRIIAGSSQSTQLDLESTEAKLPYS